MILALLLACLRWLWSRTVTAIRNQTARPLVHHHETLHMLYLNVPVSFPPHSIHTGDCTPRIITCSKKPTVLLPHFCHRTVPRTFLAANAELSKHWQQQQPLLL